MPFLIVCFDGILMPHVQFVEVWVCPYCFLKLGFCDLWVIVGELLGEVCDFGCGVQLAVDAYVISDLG